MVVSRAWGLVTCWMRQGHGTGKYHCGQNDADGCRIGEVLLNHRRTGAGEDPAADALLNAIRCPRKGGYQFQRLPGLNAGDGGNGECAQSEAVVPVGVRQRHEIRRTESCCCHSVLVFSHVGGTGAGIHHERKPVATDVAQRGTALCFRERQIKDTWRQLFQHILSVPFHGQINRAPAPAAGTVPSTPAPSRWGRIAVWCRRSMCRQ